MINKIGKYTIKHEFEYMMFFSNNMRIEKLYEDEIISTEIHDMIWDWYDMPNEVKEIITRDLKK